MNKSAHPNKSKTKSKTLEQNTQKEQCKQLKNTYISMTV